MGQLHTIGRKATKVEATKNHDFISVKYHKTEVVHFEKGTVTLNNGGYFTATTKARMNQTANEYGLNFSVYQNKFNWYVNTEKGTLPFTGKTISFEVI